MMKFLDWVQGECEMLDFSVSVHCLTPQACPALEGEPWNPALAFTSFVYLHMKLLLTYKPCALFQICVLINTFVDKCHLSLQKRFEKAEAFTAPSLASSWPCLLPDSRKAKTSSAWLKGAANVDSDKKILLRGFLGCLCLFVCFV